MKPHIRKPTSKKNTGTWGIFDCLDTSEYVQKKPNRLRLIGTPDCQCISHHSQMIETWKKLEKLKKKNNLTKENCFAASDVSFYLHL